MTRDELVEFAIRKYPMGHPIVSMALAEARFWHGYPSYVLEAVFDELPDVPPRTGDCAELLADTPGTESS